MGPSDSVGGVCDSTARIYARKETQHNYDDNQTNPLKVRIAKSFCEDSNWVTLYCKSRTLSAFDSFLMWRMFCLID
jgi:hypothetical protein